MSRAEKPRDNFAVWGERVALGSAVLLTAKGEYDLAVMAHFAWWIAWMFPVMIDVYVITASHKRRWFDVVVSLALMIFCQVAVHLVPVFITGGEETPWGLVMAVACIAPIVVVRVKALTGKTRDEIEADDRAAALAEDAREARAEAAEATRKRAEAEANLRAEAEARQAAEAEVQAEAERRKQAEAEVAAEAEARAEVERKLGAEVTRHRKSLDEIQASARDARAQAAEASELAARIAGQLEEARTLAERAIAEKLHVEQQMQALSASREAVAEELARVQQVVARLQQRAEAEGRKQAEVRGGSTGRKLPVTSASAGRKQRPELPASLPVEVPPIDGVSPEVAARILLARDANPEATRKQLADLVGVSDKTIRTVLNHPAIAGSETPDTDRAAV
jgi:hypothetical protein